MSISIVATPIASPLRGLVPGVLICATVALAARFLSDHYGGPLMLYALLFGTAFNFLTEDSRCLPGIEFTARTILRVGVALLGVRISVGQITALGVAPFAIVAAALVSTILVGWLLSRALGLRSEQGLLSGGAVAICGASAALALASVMPAHGKREEDLIVTVVGVTVLSTLAMVLYPMLVHALGLSDTAAGIFFGATIHDVAQVIGAGYLISDATGEVSTVVKLTRVALLVPTVLVFLVCYRRQRGVSGNSSDSGVRLPAFLLAFVALVGLNSLQMVPLPVIDAANDASRWCLVAAIAALGIKTSFKRLAEVGARPVAMMIGETVYLAAFVLAAIWLLDMEQLP